MKNIYRAFLYIIYKRRRYPKLIIPVLFLIAECAVAIAVNWQLFCENYTFTENEILVVDPPLLAVSFLHSSFAFPPEYSNAFVFCNNVQPVIFCLFSLLAAYAGIFISMLWINRFFHANSLDIAWWLWPVGCGGSHLIAYILPAMEHLQAVPVSMAF